MVDLNRAQPKLTFHLFDNLILICSLILHYSTRQFNIFIFKVFF